MSEKCPDALLPDGPVCPRCGGNRGPSGVGGGSWVHCSTDAYLDPSLRPRKQVDVTDNSPESQDEYDRLLSAFDEACTNSDGRTVTWRGYSHADRIRVMRRFAAAMLRVMFNELSAAQPSTECNCMVEAMEGAGWHSPNCPAAQPSASDFEQLAALRNTPKDVRIALYAAAALAREIAELRINAMRDGVHIIALRDRAESAERENAELRAKCEVRGHQNNALLASADTQRERAESAEKENAELHGEMYVVWTKLQEVAPWCPSNDMLWSDEILTGVSILLQRAESAESANRALQVDLDIEKRAAANFLKDCRALQAEVERLTLLLRNCNTARHAAVQQLEASDAKSKPKPYDPDDPRGLGHPSSY